MVVPKKLLNTTGDFRSHPMRQPSIQIMGRCKTGFAKIRCIETIKEIAPYLEAVAITF
jgi:hypothetical protein